MRFALLPSQSERILSLEPSGRVQIPDTTPVRLRLVGTTLVLRGAGPHGVGNITDSTDQAWLATVLDSGAYLAEVLKTQPKLTLRVITYDARDQWTEDRTVGVDEQTLAQLGRFRLPRPSKDPVHDAVTWLTSQVNGDFPTPAVVLAVGGSSAPNLEAFRVIGERVAIDVRMHEGRLLVDRIAPRPTAQLGRLVLVHGKVRFADATRLSQVTDVDRAELRRLAAQDNAYLEVWNRYNQLEREAKEREAREAGWARYDDRRRLSNGYWEFDLVRSQRSDHLLAVLTQGSLNLEAGPRVPFESTAMTPNNSGDYRILAGEAEPGTGNQVLLRVDVDHAQHEPPPAGFLYGSFNADNVRLRRRDEAQRRAVAARSFPIHQLSRILTGQPPLSAPGRPQRIDTMSARAQTALGAPATSRQLEAIHIALNTPDIALIQGPPGTGKTRVIAAIQARLTEIGKSYSAETMRTLLTSYQHDAVDNLAYAANDGRLPALRVASRQDHLDNSQIIQWARRTAARIADRQTGQEATPLVRSWRDLYDRQTAYLLLPPDIDGTLELLHWLSQQAALIGPDVAVDAADLRAKMQEQLGTRQSRQAHTRLLALARSLRTDPEAHADDGQLHASSAYASHEFRSLLDQDQHATLRRAATESAADPGLLEAVRRLQNDVIDRLLAAQARAAVMAGMPALRALLQRATTSADARVEAAVPAPERIVERFRRALLEEPEAVARAVSSHTQALAATCQQAVSHGMSDMQPGLQFETVIVDEAARANPLDLLIPITLASRRIILVGDHRQLPQLLDQPIVDSLTGSEQESATKDALEKSMFEDLFRRLRDLEQADGIRRIVTLDQQFRTHPVLGEFISRHFYEPHGEGFANGRPDAEAFAHDLAAFHGRPAAWIDVPASHGGESGQSKSRRAEAQVIVSELRRALDANPDLTFGVIAFYKGQVQTIWEEMHRAGLSIRVGNDHSLAPSMPMLWTSSGLERVRIGTVDAFQGREFDVTFLSTTRSNRPRRSGRRNFGFLTVRNRLCVAMSRQRRLLVVVGDAAMFDNDDAKELVAPLAAFYDLTGGEHGCRLSA